MPDQPGALGETPPSDPADQELCQGRGATLTALTLDMTSTPVSPPPNRSRKAKPKSTVESKDQVSLNFLLEVVALWKKEGGHPVSTPPFLFKSTPSLQPSLLPCVPLPLSASSTLKPRKKVCCTDAGF